MWILGWTWLFLLHLFCLGAVGLGPAWEALPFWICLGSELLIFLGSNWPSLHPDKQCADTGNSNNNWLWRQSSPDMDWEDSSFLFFSICYIFLCTASGYSGVRFCLESTAEATPEAFQQTNPSCSISYSGPVPLSNPETLWRCYAAEKSCSSTATWKIYVTSPVQNPKKPPAPSSPSLRKQARRYKRKGKLGCGNGSAPVINPGENALSIPQITYDHIGEQEDKKDVSFYIEEPGVKRHLEGNTQEMSRANSFTDDIDLISEESPLPAVSDVTQLPGRTEHQS